MSSIPHAEPQYRGLRPPLTGYYVYQIFFSNHKHQEMELNVWVSDLFQSKMSYIVGQITLKIPLWTYSLFPIFF